MADHNMLQRDSSQTGPIPRQPSRRNNNNNNNNNQSRNNNNNNPRRSQPRRNNNNSNASPSFPMNPSQFPNGFNFQVANPPGMWTPQGFFPSPQPQPTFTVNQPAPSAPVDSEVIESPEPTPISSSQPVPPQRNEDIDRRLNALTDQLVILQDMTHQLLTKQTVQPVVESSPPPLNGKKFLQHVLSCLKEYVPRVPRSLVQWYKTCIGDKCEAINDTILGENPHAPEAILRSNTLIYAIFELIKINPEKFVTNPVITFVYGSEDRDKHAIDYFNNTLTRNFGYPVDFIQYRFYGNAITPEDLRRRRTVDTTFSDFALFMDVYILGTENMTPLNIQKLGFNHWIWVGHPFPNMYGGIVNAFYVRYVDPSGKSFVLFKPDEINNPYPPHDPCDIFHKAGSQSNDNLNFVTWSIVHRMYVSVPKADKQVKIVAYSIVRGENTTTQYLEPPTIADQPATIIKLPTFDFTDGIPWWARYISFKTLAKWKLCTETHVYLDAGLRQHVQTQLLTKYYNQWSWTSCLKAVNDYLTSDLFYERCELLLPELFVDYRLKVAAALYSESCNAKANVTSSMVAVHGDAMYQANSAVSGIGKLLEKTYNPTFLATAALGISFVGYCIYRGFKPRQFAMITTEFQGETVTVDTDSFQYKLGTFIGTKILTPLINRGWDSQKLLNITYLGLDLFERATKIFVPCVLAPVLEENIKSYFGRAAIIPSAAIGFFDVLNYREELIDPDPDVTTIRFLTCWAFHTTVHYALTYLPLPTAIAAHSALNFVIGSGKRQFCSPYGLCETAKQLGRPCRVITNSLALGPALMWAGTQQMIRKYDVPIFTLSEFDLAVQSHYYFDGHHNFVTKYDGGDAFFPASRSIAPDPKKLDPTVLYDRVLLEKFKMEIRTPEGQFLGYFRYWAHQVPMYRPDTSGWNTYKMVMNRLVKAPPAILELDSDFSIDVANALIKYKETPKEYGCLLTYFNTPAQIENVNFPIRFFCIENDKYSKTLHSFSKKYYGQCVPPMSITDFIFGKPGFSFWISEEGYLLYEEHLPASKKKLMREMKIKDTLNPINLKSPETNQVTNSSKTDEVLFKENFAPRPIHREGPQFSYHVGRIIYHCSSLIKQFFQKQLITMCGLDCCMDDKKRNDRLINDPHVYVTDLSGSTDVQLSAWFESVYTTEGWHIGASGDDSLCIYNDLQELSIFEGDVSQCDHSVRLATLLYEWFILWSFGTDEDTINLLRANARAPLMVENKPLGLKVHLERSYERNTGSPDTTIGNTLIVSSLWIFFVRYFRSSDLTFTTKDMIPEIQRWFLDSFGFSMKINFWRTKPECGLFKSPTILKGWFLHTPKAQHQFTWSPLPSRLLKLGKVMTPPNVILKKTKIPKAPYSTVTLDQAWVLLVSMHKGMAPYVNLPYINNWRAATFHRYNLYRASRAYMPPVSDVAIYHETFEEAHRPQPTAPSNTDCCPCWRYMFCDRYHIQLAELIDFHNRISDVTPFTFFVHPVWSQLALIDYLS